MTNYEELYHALKVLKDNCDKNDCDTCIMSPNGRTCRINEYTPAVWHIKQPPKIEIWEED